MKNNLKLIWTEAHEKYFLKNEKIWEATEKNQFNRNFETQITCEASGKGLGTALAQLTCDGWRTYASA